MPLRIAIVVLTACLVPARAPAQGDGPLTGEAYRAGLACFERLDFQCAVELLTAAKKGAAGDPARWTDIHLKLAESHIALGARERAVLEFMELLRTDPAFRLDAPDVSPKILAALAEARERNKPPPRPQQPPPEPEPAPWMELCLAGGTEILVGADSDLLEAGPAVEIVVAFRLGEPWRLGAGIRYTAHGLSAGDSSLHLLGGWAAFGGSWQLGPAWLGASVGLGGTRFFVADGDGKSGLLIPLRLTADFVVLEGFHVGLWATPGWVITFGDQALSSFTLALGGQLVFVF